MKYFLLLMLAVLTCHAEEIISAKEARTNVGQYRESLKAIAKENLYRYVSEGISEASTNGKFTAVVSVEEEEKPYVEGVLKQLKLLGYKANFINDVKPNIVIDWNKNENPHSKASN